MKKIYFLILTLSAFLVNAQFTDDFESYPEGPYFGGQWSTWSGADNDAESVEVSTAQAQSGSKSGLIGGGGTQDAILKLGNKFTGTWTFEHSLFVPTGSSGYYNFQEDEDTAASGGIWGAEVYLGYVATAFPDNNAFLVATDELTSEAIYMAGFDIPYDAWFTMRWVYDMDEGTMTVSMDGTEIYNGPSYLDSFQLGGVDYYSADPTNQLYIDDITYVEGLIMGTTDMASSTISVYPSVVTDSFNVNAKSNISEVAVFNSLGQQVLKTGSHGTTAQVNVSALPSGVYVVKVMAGKEVKTSKIVVK